MSGQIMAEVWFVLHSFLLGAGITFCYDFFRILRRVVPHGILWISLEDMVFWLMTAGGIFSLLYYENNGVFRWIAVFSAGAGMFVYKRTLSGLFVRLVSGAANAALRFLKKILRKLAAPFYALLRLGRRKVQRAVRRAAPALRIRQKRMNLRLTAWKKKLRIMVTDRGKKRCER